MQKTRETRIWPYLNPTSPVKDFEVFQKIPDVVGTGHGDLEGLVSSDEGGQLGQGLLSRAAHSDKHHVTARVANYPGLKKEKKKK